MNLQLSIKQIKQLLGYDAKDDGDDKIIHAIASLERAQNNDIAFLFSRGDASVFDEISSDIIKNSNAGLIVASKVVDKAKQHLIVSDPLGALTKLVAFASKQNDVWDHNRKSLVSNDALVESGAQVDATAVICRGAYIGKNSIIGAQAFVGVNAYVGSESVLHPGAKLLERCKIGDRTIIHSNAVIGTDGFGYQVTKQGLRKIPQIGISVIGNDVEIGANSTITRATFDVTTVHDHVKIDCGVHIAHNVVVGVGTIILAHTIVGGSVKIGRGCQIGGHVAIKDHVTIGDGAKIVSKSGISGNVEPGKIVAGSPAIDFRTWKRSAVLMARFPEVYKSIKQIQEFIQKRQEKSFFKRLFS